LLIGDGASVKAGDQLTEGSRNPHRILEILGRDAVTQYLLREVQQVYRPQGQNIHDKHFEVIIRKMLSKVSVTESGDTDMLPGDLVDTPIFHEKNNDVTAEGGQPAQAEPVLLGITKASLNTDSFLSASSFQHTIKVLAGAAIAGKEDQLIGLKENVIIGKLIPAGTGFRTEEDELMELPDDFFMDPELVEFWRPSPPPRPMPLAWPSSATTKMKPTWKKKRVIGTRMKAPGKMKTSKTLASKAATKTGMSPTTSLYNQVNEKETGIFTGLFFISDGGKKGG